MAEKLKLAQIRGLTPNPVEGLTSFEPTRNGETVVEVSNLVVVNQALDRQKRAKATEGDNHPWAVEQRENAQDEGEWCGDFNRWNKTNSIPDLGDNLLRQDPKQIEVPKQKSNKKRRG